MNQSTIHAQLNEILISILSEDEVAPLKKRVDDGENIVFNGSGLTSLNLVEFVMGIEEKFGIEIDLEELEEAHDMAGVCAICSK